MNNVELELYKKGIEDVMEFLKDMNKDAIKKRESDDDFTRGMFEGIEMMSRHAITAIAQVNRKGY
jgi:hypothetical protein